MIGCRGGGGIAHNARSCISRADNNIDPHRYNLRGVMDILYAHLVCNEWAVEKTINIIMGGAELILLVVVC